MTQEPPPPRHARTNTQWGDCPLESTATRSTERTNNDPKTNRLLSEIIQGLTAFPKILPTKLFYDRYGSELFDRICQLEEYYPTRTETGIMHANIAEIVESAGAQHTLLEFGSGSSVKTRILLDHLPSVGAYIPVDISADHLMQTVRKLSVQYPLIAFNPIPADYSDADAFSSLHWDQHQILAYFPGSSIGNFHADQAIEFLKNVASLIGTEGGFIIGVDLQKDIGILNRAYNDSKGVTAAFNLNILAHVNREYGADFVIDNFEHYAFYNADAGRIEMHLVSKMDQICSIAGNQFRIDAGEAILTEVSYKYTLNGFAALAQQAGLEVRKVWTDADNLFSLQYLTLRQYGGR